MAPNTTPKPETVVMVYCPRCGGEGRGSWHPDGGVCYLCEGRGEVAVNIERSERYLALLRDKYRKARAEGDLEAMGWFARKGRFKRELLDLAKAEVAA